MLLLLLPLPLSPTGACPCPCNYASDASCSCRDLSSSLTVSLSKGPLWSSYPITYIQVGMRKPDRKVVALQHRCNTQMLHGTAASLPPTLAGRRSSIDIV